MSAGGDREHNLPTPRMTVEDETEEFYQEVNADVAERVDDMMIDELHALG